MSKVTILGGALGAGKTTLLSSLIRNNSLTCGDGIIIMDAAGDVDYSRIRTLALERNIPIVNATSSCTVCDGPESAFKQLSKMSHLENVVIELSGQMPLSVMNTRLAAKNVADIQSIYLLDPSLFTLVQAADEVSHAGVVGLTKKDSDIDIKKYNPFAKIIRIPKDAEYSLRDLFRDIPKKGLFFFPQKEGKHTHSTLKGMVSRWSHKVHNPYHTEEECKRLLRPLSFQYDRVKGYIALDSQAVLSFDGVNGVFDSEILTDPSLGNGVILLANGNDVFFSEADALKRTTPFIQKPDIAPVIRRGSERRIFEEYITQALESKQYDDALGAAEQYAFEQTDFSLKKDVLPSFIKGKYAMIFSGDLSRSQRLRQNMSVLYHLVDQEAVLPELFADLSRLYKEDYMSMTDVDWSEIRSGSNPDDVISYIHLINNKL